jgi:hypothetical protein
VVVHRMIAFSFHRIDTLFSDRMASALSPFHHTRFACA